MPIGFYWVYNIGLMCHIGPIRLLKRKPNKRKREAIRPQIAVFKDKNHKKELSLFTLGGMSLETGLGDTKHRRVTRQICNPIEIYIRK